MTKILLTLLFFFSFMHTAFAKCDPAYAPYYHQQEVGPGSIIADIFLFPFALAIGTAGAPSEVARPKRRTRGGAELSRHPLCMAGFLARHAVEQRPVRVEHYRND